MVMDRDAILKADDLVSEVVDVPEWGGKVRVRSLTGQERDAYEQSITRRRGTSIELNLVNARAKLIALTVVDDAGARVFADDDVVELGKKNATALNRVFEVAQRLSGLTEDDVKDLTATLGDGPADGPSSD
jgi:hypothetical protein